MNGQVGSPNALPWPSIDCVVDSGVELQRLFESGATALVTEKLDGSNLCLHSNGVVASRRTVLANNSSLKDFKSLRCTCCIPHSVREGDYDKGRLILQVQWDIIANAPCIDERG